MNQPSDVRRSNRFVPLRVSMAAAFAVTAIITSVLVGFVIFWSTRDFVLNGIRRRLVDIATLSADRISADTHAGILTREDEASDAYARVKRDLMDIRAVSPDIRYVYTYRIDQTGRTTFVVDVDAPDSPGLSHVGDVYDSPTAQMRSVYLPGAMPVAEDTFTADEWGVWLSCFAPVRNAAGEVECGLGIDMSVEAVRRHERVFQRTIVLAASGIGAVVALLGVWYARRISRPLLELAGELGRVERLELDHRVEIRSWVREVVVMRDAVQRLKTGLRSFRKYVPAELVAELMALGQEARLSAEKREVTVFFSDIADFTTISEQTPPERLVGDLAVYFDGMTRSIIERGGTVDKYIGDSVMAFWGAPRPMPSHAVEACRAALRCRDHSRRVAESRDRAGGGLPMLTRIGLNTGAAIIGNIGYDERLNYTAMGDVVNLASRLEGLNKFYGTQILVSESTWREARDQFEARLVDRVAVKGRSEPVRVYELLAERGGLIPAQSDLVAAYERALTHYMERRFAEAAEAFGDLLKKHPEDNPSVVLRERCRAYVVAPPPPDWRGEFVATSK